MSTPLWNTPISLGSMRLRNRIVFPPMSTKFASPGAGEITERMLAYYEARAKGGAGLVIVKPAVFTMPAPPLRAGCA